ncbi:MAG: GNAT family N-acetyltransferase, partial [Planctomycetia bacterium]|nr:GNAT family N-acetyltransferase [Planctomycetia bacterium]
MAGKKTEIITERKGPHLMRSLLVDGALASWVTIIDHKIRIGRASMLMGGIGGVNTKVEHRRRGHMRRLMADSVRFMQERGYVFSMLFGIENFYQKFGYEVSLPEYRMTMQTRDAKRAGDLPFCRRYSVRLARPADFPAICLIHNR